MAAKKKRRNIEELPRFEWDFSSCPTELIWNCWLFEYSREHIKQGGSLPHWMEDFFTKNMQFPKTPFLQLHKIGRAPLITETGLMSATEDDKNLKGELHSLAKYLSVWGDYNSVHATRERVNWDGVWKIKIDWSHSTTKLTKDFARFLQEIRPKASVAPEKRGKRLSSIRLAELKQLGAFRLQEAGYTIKCAKEYTKEISGSHLYSYESNWSEAKKKAKSILSEWPPAYLRPAS